MARAFALGLMALLLGVPGEANPDPVPEPLWSEAADIVRSPIGTVKLCKLFWLGWRLCGCAISSKGGGSSAAGMGRPLAAATSWCSAQFEDQSFRPRQKGASLLSTCLIMLAVLPSNRGVMNPGRVYLKLPHNWFVEILGSDIGTQSYQIASIDMLLPQASFPILKAGRTLPLEASSFSFLLGFSMLEWYVLPAVTLTWCANPEE